MAGGPLSPSSITYAADGVTGGVHVGGTNSREIQGTLLEASPSVDNTVRLYWDVIPTLPTGTFKLQITSVANATSGTVVYDPQWIGIAAEADLDPASLNAEGNTTTTWASGDDDALKITEITLDADTLAAGDSVYMELVFDSTSTMAAVSTHKFALIWE